MSTVCRDIFRLIFIAYFGASLYLGSVFCSSAWHCTIRQDSDWIIYVVRFSRMIQWSGFSAQGEGESEGARYLVHLARLGLD
jgi:hypothetical protein